MSKVRVGLTGGVGSGKSTVAALLADHGAVVIDADALAREVVEPGTPGLAAVVREFGPDIVAADGRLDRAALAAIVFADDDRRARLNAIVHPLIRERTAELDAAAPPDCVVVHDVPLLAERGARARYDVVVVVEASPELRLRRLAARGMPEPDARKRMAAQASDEQRRALADHLVRNDGSRADLAREVGRLWERLRDQGGERRGGLEGPADIG